MTTSEKMNNQFKSLSLQRDRVNVNAIDRNTSSYTDDGYVTQNNECNRSVTRKSSIKHKLFSLFKSHSKRNHKSDVNSIDNSARNSVTQDIIQADSSHSTLSNNPGQITSKTFINTIDRQSQLTNEHYKNRDRLDSRDRQLINQLSLHSLTEAIVECVSELPRSSIKLPSSWINNIGPHISNKSLQPFLTSIPGLSGLKNHGNTCYVNVIVQCLAHIDSFAQYFATKDYLADLRLTESNSSPKADGSGLDVVVALSYLLQSLWQYTYQPKVSIKFCQLLTLHKTQFSIDSQQDAHELLLCVLNLLHDNLSRPVADPAEETSFIYDKFRGWLSNDITCPQCGYSRKFKDQIISLNLPIPKAVISEENRFANEVVFCIVVINGCQLAEKHAFEINKSTTNVANIRAGIAGRLGCEAPDVVLLELVDSGFGQMYSDIELIADIAKKNNYLSPNGHENFENGLYAVYIPNQVVDVDSLSIDTWADNNIYSTMKRRMDLWDSQPFIRLLVVHVEKNKEYVTEVSDDLHRTLNMGVESGSSTTINSRMSFNQKHLLRFTNVLTVQAARKTKLGLLRHSLSEQMCKYLNLKNVTKLPKPQFLIEGSHLVSELDMYPLSHISVTMALKQSAEVNGEESAVVRLVVVWPPRTTQLLRCSRRVNRDSARGGQFMSLNNQRLLLHRSVDELIAKQNAASDASSSNKDMDSIPITINDCLRAFFSLDSLSVTEPWNCPGCQTTQQAHTNIRIKEAPEILIIMLKRFTNGHNSGIDSPLSQHTLERRDLGRKHSSRNYQNGNFRKDNLSKKNLANRADDYLNKLETFIDYPVEGLDVKAYMENASEEENYQYDLVGVVNHRGNLSNGHYVAMCQNSIDNQWRVYDDDRVTEISKTDVVNPDAYILFYKRQSNSSDLNTDLNLHWSYRRLSFPDKIHRNQTPNPTSVYSTHRRYSDRDPSNTRRSYGTLPLTMSNNNHHSSNSINSRLSSIIEKPVLERSILSPHWSSSSNSSLIRCDSASTPTIFDNDDDDDKEFIDIRTIVSTIVDLESYSSTGSSMHDDSGAVLSRLSSCTMPPKIDHQDSDPGNNDRDECYNSLSTSPCSSSPKSASKKLSIEQSAAPFCQPT